jgi:sedoheptulokinase
MGIDIGTTSISMVMLEERTQLIARRTINHNTFLDAGETKHKMQDPHQIWLLVKQNLGELIECYGMPDCIGFTGQMHGMLYVDEKGEAVSPLYTWQDGCGEEQLESGQTVVELLGKAVRKTATGYGLTTHYYLQQKGQIPEKAKKMTTISDYVAMKLCENTEPVISMDMAASWGCFDLEHQRFEHEKLEALGVNLSYLPRIEKNHVFIGRYQGSYVLSSLGDNQASVLGAVDEMEDRVVLNVGTGSQISFATDAYLECAGSIELRPCNEQYSIMVGASLCGGRAYALLEKFYREIHGGEESLYSMMSEQAEIFLKDHGIEEAWKITTTFAGTRDNPNEKGRIEQIHVDNFHPAAMTVGMLVGILQELYDTYQAMCRLSGRTGKKLIGSGNGIRKNPLMQRLAQEMFQLPLEISVWEEEAACGAALCALETMQAP